MDAARRSPRAYSANVSFGAVSLAVCERMSSAVTSSVDSAGAAAGAVQGLGVDEQDE